MPTLLPHLSPHPSEIAKSFVDGRKIEIGRISRIGKVSLNSSSISGSGGGSSSSNTQKSPTMGINGNQILRLLRSLFRVGISWDIACSLLDIDYDEVVMEKKDHCPQKDEVTTATICSNNNDSNLKRGRRGGEEMLAACCAIYPPLGRELRGYCLRIIEGPFERWVGSPGSVLLPSRNGSNNTSITESCGKDAMDTEVGRGQREWRNEPHSLLPKTGEVGATWRLSPNANLNDVAKAILHPLAVISQAGSASTSVASVSVLSSPAGATFYCKLCRLVKALLLNGQSNTVPCTAALLPAQRLLRTFLMPSLCLFPQNPAVCHELWSILSILPYRVRYTLYDSVKSMGLEKDGLRGQLLVNKATGCGPPRKPLPQVESEMRAGVKVRSLMKRVSHENVKDMGRKVSKASHSNPLIVFGTVLSRVESYDNLVSLVVDALQFVTPLGLDVMGYSLLAALGGGESCKVAQGHSNTIRLGNREKFKGECTYFLIGCPDFHHNFIPSDI